MILYFDASALVKLLIAERGSNAARSLWRSPSNVVSSWISFAEVTSAIARARRGGRITKRTASSALATWREEWSSVFPVEVEAVTGHYAGALAAKHGLRGMDAIHLASALLVREARPTVVTWDAELRRAAEAEDLMVAR